MAGRISPAFVARSRGFDGAAGLVLVLGGVYFVLSLNFQGETYPGSLVLNSDGVFKLAPFVYYRQAKVYVTDDYIPIVYRWYSNTFGMSADHTGQSNCLALYAKSIGIIFTKVMQVKVCDTINGRMIFDERSIQLK